MEDYADVMKECVREAVELTMEIRKEFKQEMIDAVAYPPVDPTDTTKIAIELFRARMTLIETYQNI